MSAYNPPLFNNSVIQFNPTIYETGTTSTASQALTLLKTDNIQCLLPNDSVTLYTVASGPVTLGTSSSTVTVNGSLLANTIDKSSGAISLYATASGNITLGSSGSAITALNSPITTATALQTNSIDKKASGPISLYQTAVGTVTLGANATNVDIQAIRIAAGSIYPSSSQTLYIGNSNAPTIELGATSCSTLNIGSVNSTSYFKNIKSAIFGFNPNSYLPAGTGSLTDCGTRIYNSVTQSSIDLFSAGASFVNALPSSSFTSVGGTAFQNSAALTISSSTINIESVAATTIGSNTTTYNYLRNSFATVIGGDPASHSPTVGTVTGSAIRLYNNSVNSSVDMYSSNLTAALPSSRFISTGGSTAINSGGLVISSGSINLSSSGTVQVGNSTNTNTIGNLAVIGSQIYPISSSAMTVGYANTTSVTVGSTSLQNPVTISGIGYFTNNNIQSLRTDYASFGGTQISWNRTGGQGETNIIGYQGPGGSGGVVLANVNASGTYQELISANSSRVYTTPNAMFNGGISFTKGNVTNASYIQTGEYFNSGFVIGSNSFFSATITFSPAFSAIPFVYASNGSVQNTTCSRLVVGATNISTSQFTMTFYNNAGAGGTSGACTVRWMALGGW